MLYDFYVLSFISTINLAPEKSKTASFGDVGFQGGFLGKSDRVKEDIEYAQDVLLPVEKTKLIKGLFVSICAEISHVEERNKSFAGTPLEKSKVFKYYIRNFTLMTKGLPKEFQITRVREPKAATPMRASYKISYQAATKAIKDGKAGAGVKEAYESENFPSLAHKLGVKVIHIAERDTQVTDKPKQVNEFVNTWSVEGFYEEGIAPAELGWGTHEKTLPINAYQHPDGPKNQICIAQPGAKTWVRSWVPNMETTGMVIRHGEAFTISDHLTVWDKEKAVYRPTVHYAYCPTDAAVASMHELEMRQWDLTTNQRIMNEEIIDGDDRLGVLLMGHAYKSWWTGSLLNIHDSRKLIPKQSATTVQVASAVYAAVAWAMANPNAGYRVPDDLPWREVLAFAEKYWGGYHSEAADWDPLMHRNDLYKGWNNRKYDESDPWQFSNFLV
jgi:homospermidine synthase